jgi:hypothetical protein
MTTIDYIASKPELPGFIFYDLKNTIPEKATAGPSTPLHYVQGRSG